MRETILKSLGKHLAPPLRQCVSPLAFVLKKRKMRLALLRCLFTYPEYSARLAEVTRIALRDAKMKGFTKSQANFLVEVRQNQERQAIYFDMQSSYTHLLALLKYSDINQPDLTELYRHVYAKPTFLYISD